MSSGISRPSRNSSHLVGAGASAGIPRGAGSGRVPFPAQIPVRPEVGSVLEMDAVKLGFPFRGIGFDTECVQNLLLLLGKVVEHKVTEVAVDFVEQCRPRLPRRSGRTASVSGTSWGVSLKSTGSKRFHALCLTVYPRAFAFFLFFQFVLITPIVVPLFPVAHAIPPNTSVARFRSAGPGAPNSPDNIQRCQGSLSLQGSRGEVLLWVTAVRIGPANAADSGNSPAAAAGRWAVCGEQAAPCRRQVPCRNRSSTFPQPYREKVEKVCRQNRSHRHLPDRRNSGNGCPPSCWGVYPHGRDSTSCRSGLRRSVKLRCLPGRDGVLYVRKDRGATLRPNGWGTGERTKPGEGRG